MVAALSVDGTLRAPEISVGDRLLFRVNLPVREIRLVSGFARPVDFGESGDQRRLGVALCDMRWQQGDTAVAIPIDSPGFMDGFHHVERDSADNTPFRWTNGDAALPAGFIPPWQGEAHLRLTVKNWRGSAVRTPPRDAAIVFDAFESLGDDCELALAQRHFGVELPLGLLRWSSTTHERLLAGLDSRFEGLGDPATTQVVWDTTDYRLQTRYLRMHTTVIEPRDEAGVADILHCGEVTLRLLRRKLLRDIADAKRIFVFKTADPDFRQAQMHRLHAALRRIGPASLLCVTLRQPQQSRHPVERLAEGLYAGDLDRFVLPDGPFDEWLDLCAGTLTLHRAG